MGIKRKIIRWLKRDWYNDETPEAVPVPGYGNGSKIGSSHSIESPVRFNFTVIPASGGRIIEFNTYDHVRDRSVNTVHVIPEEADFTDELTKIVSVEILKN